ncbi:MAG: SIMPL domain-containing protein [Candidatus Levyibacteriota bacterium]
MKDKAFLKEYLLKPACYAAVIIAAFFILSKFMSLNFTLASNQTAGTFEVVGTGKVTATPNIAETTFTIQEKADTQDAAKSKANEKQNQAIDEITKLGIKKADIKTESFNVNPNYDDSTTPVEGTMMYPIRKTTQNGYIATIITSIKSDKIEVMNQAIDKLTPLGINVAGVNYTFADQEVYKAQAVEKAVTDAKQKAEALAKTGGFQVGKLVTIRNVDEGGGYPVPMMAKGAAPSADSSTNLEPGSNDITARVAITYYIK